MTENYLYWFSLFILFILLYYCLKMYMKPSRCGSYELMISCKPMQVGHNCISFLPSIINCTNGEIWRWCNYFLVSLTLIIIFHLGENTKQTQPSFPPLTSEPSSHMVQLSSVTTWFSVNLYKCGLDPQGRDSLASTPAMDQQAFLCAPSGLVPTGKRQVLHLTCAVRTNSEKDAQNTHLQGNEKMPRSLNCLSPEILHHWIPPTLNIPWPWLASCQMSSKENTGICVCMCECVHVHVLFYSAVTHSSPL